MSDELRVKEFLTHHSSLITHHPSLYLKHSVERDARPARGLFGHGYTVDDAALCERVERPCEVLRGDAVHRGAHAEVGREQSYVFVRVLLDEAVDEVDFGANRPRGA